MSSLAGALGQASTDVYNIGLGVQNQLFFDNFTRKEFEAKARYFQFQAKTSGIPSKITNAGSRFAGPTYGEQLRSLSEQTTGALNQLSAGLQENVNDVQAWSQENQNTIGAGWGIGHAAGGLVGGMLGALYGWNKANQAPKPNLSFTPVNVETNTGFQNGRQVDPNTVGSHNYIINTENHINAGLGYYVQTGKDPRGSEALLNSQSRANASSIPPNYGIGTTIYNKMEAKGINPTDAENLIQMHPNDGSIPSYPVGSSDGQTTLSQAQSSPTQGVNPMRGGTITTMADVHAPLESSRMAIPSVPYTDDVREAKLVKNNLAIPEGSNNGKGYDAVVTNIPTTPYTDETSQSVKIINPGIEEGSNSGAGFQATTSEVPETTP